MYIMRMRFDSLPGPDVWSPDGPVLLDGVRPVFRSHSKFDGLFGSFCQWHIPSKSNSQSSEPEI